MITEVQSATGVTNSTYQTTVTVTFGSPVTAGNCLVIAIGGFGGGVNGVTIGGSPDYWAQAVAAQTGILPFVYIWTDPHCAGGSEVIVVSYADGAPLAAVAWEFTGIAAASPVDRTAAQNVYGAPYVTSFTSTATAATSHAQELWIGCVATNSDPAIAPSAPWVNSAQLNAGVASDATFMASYQITAAAGAAEYTGVLTGGTYRPADECGAAVATLLPGTPAPPVAARLRRGTAAIVRSANW